MKDIKKVSIAPTASIREAMEKIDEGAIKIAFVTDDNLTLLGTISDGDIRRAILKGINLDDSIVNIYNTNPIKAYADTPVTELEKLAKHHNILRIPIVDDEEKLICLELVEEMSISSTKPNKVILMVGGLGTRLRPLTDNTPKPMLHVGGKPILETIVERFATYGFINIVMCIGYKSHVIQDYFGDGSSFGVNIEYILEDKRMGTAGALSLLKEKLTDPFFVMNGDLLTNVNFDHLCDYHIANHSKATMCVREYDFQVPFGVVNLKGHNITSIEEKPVHNFFVSAGIYMLDPSCIDMIPNDEFYDMPTLFEKMIAQKDNVISFPLREYWLDIGRIEEYEKANNEYHGVFS